MLLENLYDKTPEEYLKLEVNSLSQEEIKELAYYIWSVFPEHEEIQAWRSTSLLPLLEDSN